VHEAAGYRSVAHRAAARAAVNPYVDLGVEFRYFFARKTMFVKYADGFAIFPGGSARLTSCSSR